MKSGMVLFPGSNCEWESLAFLKHLYGPSQVTMLWHRDRFDPKALDLIFLPGGFSYGDYLRAGACAAASPAMQDVISHAKRGATVVGVCNGFQTLVETHLLPGVLIRNASGQFQCQWVDLQPNASTVLKWSVGSAPLRLPIANKFGRFYVPPHVRWQPEKQVVFRYANTGEPAAITNTLGNILGMMPHPERATFAWHPSQEGRRCLPGEGSWR